MKSNPCKFNLTNGNIKASSWFATSEMFNIKQVHSVRLPAHESLCHLFSLRLEVPISRSPRGLFLMRSAEAYRGRDFRELLYKCRKRGGCL